MAALGRRQRGGAPVPRRPPVNTGGGGGGGIGKRGGKEADFLPTCRAVPPDVLSPVSDHARLSGDGFHQHILPACDWITTTMNNQVPLNTRLRFLHGHSM